MRDLFRTINDARMQQWLATRPKSRRWLFGGSDPAELTAHLDWKLAALRRRSGGTTIDRGRGPQPGDLVVVRYNDEQNKTVTISISRHENKPEFGVVHVSEPLAQAVLGRTVGEEIEVAIGDRIRLGVIEHIERKAA